MISTETLFILGAGASCPFGLPSGAQLRNMLCEELQNQTDFRGLLHACRFKQDHITEFGRSFLLSNQPSIDAFLALRPEFQNLGLHAIAAALLPRERMKGLYTSSRRWGDSDWFGYLWGRMRADAETREAVAQNKVAFITFNYDRTLEVLLFNALQHSFGLDVGEAHKAMGHFPIYHVYGDLGGFDAQVGGYKFDIDVRPHDVEEASRRLRVVPGVRPNSDPTCASMIQNAKRIFFLGFSYDSTNIARLGYAAATQSAELRPRIFGTTFGLLRGEKLLAQNLVQLGPSATHMESVTALEMLQHFAEHLR